MRFKVYYFQPSFDDIDLVERFGRSEVEWYGENHPKVHIYSFEEFELMFNLGCIDELGKIRIINY